MNIIAGIVVLILFRIALIMFWQSVEGDKKPFSVTLYSFLQMIVNFIVAIYLFRI